MKKIILILSSICFLFNVGFTKTLKKIQTRGKQPVSQSMGITSISPLMTTNVKNISIKGLSAVGDVNYGFPRIEVYLLSSSLTELKVIGRDATAIFPDGSFAYLDSVLKFIPKPSYEDESQVPLPGNCRVSIRLICDEGMATLEIPQNIPMQMTLENGTQVTVYLPKATLVSNPITDIILYVASDGSTYLDPQLTQLVASKPSPSEKKEKVELKLIWKQRFDTVPANKESILSKPPEITAEMLKPILKTENKLIFFDEQGKISKELELIERDMVLFSKNGEFLSVSRYEPPSGEEKEDETSAEVKVYDKLGNLLYKYGSSSSEDHVISNTGASVELEHLWNNRLRFFNRNGEEIKIIYPFGSHSGVGYGNQFYGKFSADGSKFIVYATDYLTDRLNWNAYIILYDNLGNELWRKKLDIKESTESFQISDNGDSILLGDNSENKVFLLNGNGNVLKIIPQIRLVLAQLEFNPDTNEFVVNPGLDKTYVINSSGDITMFKTPFDVSMMATSKKYIANVAEERKGQNIILILLNKNAEELLTRNLGGNKKDLETLSVNFVSDDIVAIQFSNETRYYKIIQQGK